MDLAAGHSLAQRSVLVLEQPDSGDADQHELPREPCGVDLAFEHVQRRNEPMGIARRIVDANGAVTLGRHGEVADAHAFDIRSRHVQPDRRRADRRAQHLDREGGHEGSVDVGGKRNAADRPAFGIDGDEPVPGSRAIQRFDARQHAGIVDESGIGGVPRRVAA